VRRRLTLPFDQCVNVTDEAGAWALGLERDLRELRYRVAHPLEAMFAAPVTRGPATPWLDVIDGRGRIKGQVPHRKEV